MQRGGIVNNVIQIYRNFEESRPAIPPKTAETDVFKDPVPGRSILSYS